MRIVKDSKGNEYIDETYGQGIMMDKTDKMFLTLYRHNNKYKIMLYRFESNRPVIVKNIYKYMTKGKLLKMIEPIQENIYIKNNPLFVYSRMRTKGYNISLDDIYGKIVYVITPGATQIQLCSCLDWNIPNIDVSMRVNIDFIHNNREYGIDVTEKYQNIAYKSIK